ncbi:MAG: cyclic nucleotide-binding domain-containing protein [Gammaproteobacteria bacterium]
MAGRAAPTGRTAVCYGFRFGAKPSLARHREWIEPLPQLAASTWVVEASGYVAAAMVFLAFYTKTMLPLRYLAIGSNLAFIVYGALGQLNPVLFLHIALLPLNVLRLWQLKRLIADAAKASADDFSVDWLLPYMSRRRVRAGEYLFRVDDYADEIFYIVRGTVSLPEVGVERTAGDMIGEIGLFAPNRARIASARCETDCELLTISEEKVLNLYYQSPEFGIYLVRLITGRLVRKVDRLKQRR